VRDAVHAKVEVVAGRAVPHPAGGVPGQTTAVAGEQLPLVPLGEGQCELQTAVF